MVMAGACTNYLLDTSLLHILGNLVVAATVLPKGFGSPAGWNIWSMIAHANPEPQDQDILSWSPGPLDNKTEIQHVIRIECLG